MLRSLNHISCGYLWMSLLSFPRLCGRETAIDKHFTLKYVYIDEWTLYVRNWTQTEPLFFRKTKIIKIDFLRRKNRSHFRSTFQLLLYFFRPRSTFFFWKNGENWWKRQKFLNWFFCLLPKSIPFPVNVARRKCSFRMARMHLLIFFHPLKLNGNSKIRVLNP